MYIESIKKKSFYAVVLRHQIMDPRDKVGPQWVAQALQLLFKATP
jgi:hypothetical protein